jgi:hypothetical protein
LPEPPAPIEPVAAVFDLDGTLVVSEAADRAAWRALFASRGRPLAEQLLESHILGRRDKDVLDELRSEYHGEDPAALAIELSHYEAEGPCRSARSSSSTDCIAVGRAGRGHIGTPRWRRGKACRARPRDGVLATGLGPTALTPAVSRSGRAPSLSTGIAR